MSARAQQIASVEKRIDNLIGAMQLPLPAQYHLDQLKLVLPELRDTLRLIYIAETGDDPWTAIAATGQKGE
jgi:hypothetical protein